MSEAGAPGRRVKLKQKPLPPQIGPYRVLKRIGQGGAGVVYLGEDPSLGRTVAIKVLHKRIAQDAQHVERFKREARVMAQINSPYVAAIYQVGEHEGLPYLVMEYLDGENLEMVLKRERRVEVGLALSYVRDAALGLDSAATSGIIHRDVKPANLVVEGARAKITDFGVARPLDGSAQVTLAGQIAGTAAFMSPERIKGADEDLRSDIYALGATLYTLVAGRPPFVKSSPLEVLNAHLDERPTPLVRIVRELPDGLSELVESTLEKDPGARPQTYQEMIDALHACMEDMGVPVEPTGRFVPPPSSQVSQTAIPVDPGGSAMVPQMSGVMGTLKQMSVVEIVQLLEMGKKSALVEITPTGGSPGAFGAEDGRVVYASCAGLDGEEAFFALTGVKEGAFQIHYGAAAPEHNVAAEGTFLLIEAMRRVDEARAGEDTVHDEQTLPPDGALPDAFGAQPTLIHSSAPLDDATEEDLGRTPEPVSALTAANEDALEPMSFEIPRTDVINRASRTREDHTVPDELPPSFNEPTLNAAQPSPFDAVRNRLSSEIAYIKAKLGVGLAATQTRVSGTFARPAAPLFLAGALGSFILLVVVVLVAVFWGDPLTLREAKERIKAGEAAAVLTEIERLSDDDRTPQLELARAHALADLGQPALALKAYRAATARGAADEPALAFVVSQLKDGAAAPAAVDVLVKWPDIGVRDRLFELVEGNDPNLRALAVTILKERAESDSLDFEAIAIKDLAQRKTCAARRRALLQLKDISTSEKARAAVLEARKRPDNRCMRAEFKEMLGR